MCEQMIILAYPALYEMQYALLHTFITSNDMISIWSSCVCILNEPGPSSETIYELIIAILWKLFCFHVYDTIQSGDKFANVTTAQMWQDVHNYDLIFFKKELPHFDKITVVNSQIRCVMYD